MTGRYPQWHRWGPEGVEYCAYVLGPYEGTSYADGHDCQRCTVCGDMRCVALSECRGKPEESRRGIYAKG